MKAIVSPTFFLSAWTCLQYLFSDKENYIECIVDANANLLRIHDLKHTINICMPLLEEPEQGVTQYSLSTLPKISIKAKTLETNTKVIFEDSSVTIDSFTVNIQPSKESLEFPEVDYLPKTVEEKPYFSTAYYLKNIASLSGKFPDKSYWYFDPSDKSIYSTSKDRVSKVRSDFYPSLADNSTSGSKVVIQLFKKLVSLFDAYDRYEDSQSLVFGEQSEGFYIEYFFNPSEVTLPDSIEYSKAVLASKADPSFTLVLDDPKQVFNDLKIIKDQVDKKHDTVQLLIEDSHLCFKAYSEMSEASTFVSVVPVRVGGELKNSLYLLNKELLASLDMFKSSKEVMIRVWEKNHLIEIKNDKYCSNFILRLLVK